MATITDFDAWLMCYVENAEEALNRDAVPMAMIYRKTMESCLSKPGEIR